MTKKFIEDNDLRRSNDRHEGYSSDAFQHGESPVREPLCPSSEINKVSGVKKDEEIITKVKIKHNSCGNSIEVARDCLVRMLKSDGYRVVD